MAGKGPAPENQFLGAGHGTNRPWKYIFKGGPPHEPPLKMLFPGAVDAMTRPWKFFYSGGSQHDPPLKFFSHQVKIWNCRSVSAVLNHSNFCFPPIYSNLFPAVFNYSNFCFPPIFTSKSIVRFNSAFQNSISAKFPLLFERIDDEYIS